MLQRENDWRQGRRVGPTFWEKRQLHEASRILAALPGAGRREGAQPPRRSHMACRDGEWRSAVSQQYFITQRRGKSCSTCVAFVSKKTISNS